MHSGKTTSWGNYKRYFYQDFFISFMHIRLYAHIRTLVRKSLYIHMHMHVLMLLHLRYTCTHTYIYIYINIHMLIHIYIHITDILAHSDLFYRFWESGGAMPPNFREVHAYKSMSLLCQRLKYRKIWENTKVSLVAKQFSRCILRTKVFHSESALFEFWGIFYAHIKYICIYTYARFHFGASHKPGTSFFHRAWFPIKLLSTVAVSRLAPKNTLQHNSIQVDTM